MGQSQIICNNSSAPEAKSRQKKPRIFQEKENVEPPKCLFLNSSLIINIPKTSDYSLHQDIYRMIQPISPAENDPEVDMLWQKAASRQANTNGYLQRTKVTKCLPDGSVYVGPWFKNKPHGQGKLFSDDKRLLYEGDFKLGQFNGHGTQFFDGKMAPKNEIITNLYADKRFWKCYTGEFLEGQFDGNGVVEFMDGSCFYGWFSEGQPSGVMTYENLQLQVSSQSCWKDGQLI